VPSIVLDGHTGILEDAHAPAAAYCRRLLALINDRERYRAMARAARAQFETKLTWERFASSVVETIERALP
jgi:glycosyltransferase involved in cell wall biosynthesis